MGHEEEMSTYVKRPIEIQAVQWFKNGDHPEVEPRTNLNNEDEFFIDTLEGKMKVIPGDWIVTGIKGEHYPVKDEIFKETYEEVP